MPNPTVKRRVPVAKSNGEAADLGHPDFEPQEIVIDAKTGRVRQAGADQTEGPQTLAWRLEAERDLYVFNKSILGRNKLTPKLHGWLARWIQRIPARRKLVLMPRGHFKTTMISQGLPIHILIQPADNEATSEHNVYHKNGLSAVPLHGCDTRILLVCEKAEMAQARLRWIETQFETNTLLRGFWPHRCWDKPRRDAKKWNEGEMMIPRTQDFIEPSVCGLGVGGAVTGYHYDVLIKDDLISIEAANSPVVMQGVIDWHRASRALMSPQEELGLEFIIGTRWAVKDLYESITERGNDAYDPSVHHITRAIVEDGECILPEYYCLGESRGGKTGVETLMREHGVLFWLLYMNSAADPALTDFDIDQLRNYTLQDGVLLFDEDDRDIALADMPPPVAIEDASGPDNAEVIVGETGQDAWFRDRGHSLGLGHSMGWLRGVKKVKNQ